MASLDRSIDVDVPVRTAYNQWTQFEEFPRFMSGVEEVRQLDDSRLFWVAEVGGDRKEWHARITQQEPDRVIAWESEGGAYTSGMVTFTPMGEDGTQITLHLKYEPENVLERVGDSLGILSNQVEGDLERFKHFIEERGSETGAWRGSVRGGEASER